MKVVKKERERKNIFANLGPFSVELLLLNQNKGSSDNLFEKYKFTGQERDYSTNLDYMHFRFYASSMGRFLKPDNIIAGVFNPQSWNLYTYVNGNPANFNDPTGHDLRGAQPHGMGIAQAKLPSPVTGNVWEATAMQHMTFTWTEYYSVITTRDAQGNILSVSEPQLIGIKAGIRGQCDIPGRFRPFNFNESDIRGKEILIVVVDPSENEHFNAIASYYSALFWDMGASCVDVAGDIGELYNFEGMTFDLTLFLGHGYIENGEFRFGSIEGGYTISPEQLAINWAFQNKDFGTTYWMGCNSQWMAFYASSLWHHQSYGFYQEIWGTENKGVYWEPGSLVHFGP